MIHRHRKIPDALLRVLFILVLFSGAVLLARSLLPAEVTDRAHHVRSSMEREAARPLHYAGQEACAACHDQGTLTKSGHHEGLSCEMCHGPALAHAEDPGSAKPVIPRRREFCTGCHRYNPSRPTGFPQINPATHNPMKECSGCHDPHDPKPPNAPQECSACHGEIARTKAFSPHVQLECTTCHAVPEGHKVSPRAFRAGIPSGREFCGTCHAAGASGKEIATIDLATHGEKYACWQCHYPHLPEVN